MNSSEKTAEVRTRQENLKLLVWQYENNRSITSSWHETFLVLYIVIGIVAVFANGLVVIAVFRNKKVRTPRNILIFHLAVTDLALAATIPLSAIDALSKYWPWGDKTDWLCKISRSAPTTLVFMVSFIIIVIAADRYRCIVLRNHTQMTRAVALIMLPIAFIIASFVSIPLTLHSQLVIPPKLSPKFNHVVFCLEDWASEAEIPFVTDIDGLNLTHRGIYSCAVALLQYLLPLLVVLIIYAMIYRFLRQQQYPRHLRQNNTNLLLASISITHCLIWLPFSVFNILADLWGEKLFHNDPEFTITVFCAVQLVGLTSTCTNPVLYAFFNENLRKEFEFLIDCICPTAFSRSRLHTNMNGETRSQGSSPNCVSYNLNNCRGKAEQQKLRPRRDEQNGGVLPSIDIDLDPTIGKETGEDGDCNCFKDIDCNCMARGIEGVNVDIEMAPLSSNVQ